MSIGSAISRPMPNWIRNLIITGVALAAISVVVSRLWSDRQSAWETRVEAVSATARENLDRALEAEGESTLLRSQAAAVASEASTHSDSTDAILVNLPPPTTPLEYTQVDVIVRLVTERNMWRTAYDTQVAATAKLQVGFDKLLTRGDSLQSVLDDRPGARPWFLPRLGLGPAFGTNDQGVHFDPITVNLSWEIKL